MWIKINPSTWLRINGELSRTIKNLILDILFPKFCFNCQKEGDYLCQDCQSLFEISGFHQNHFSRAAAKGEEESLLSSTSQNLNDLYFAVNYKNPLIKKLIQCFKYEPLVKELAKPLSSLIITHFQLIDNKPNFFSPAISASGSGTRVSRPDFVLIPVPLHKKRLKWRGFNQAETLSKELAGFFRIPLISNCLIKIKETFPQIELSNQERKENVKGVFLIKDKELIKNKNVLLIDDVYTTGSTMQECAGVLKNAGVKKIIGIVVARG